MAASETLLDMRRKTVSAKPAQTPAKPLAAKGRDGRSEPMLAL